ncbi:MAG: hypothetical protein MUC50_07875 [Myxococcota bacterium]|nr:hypothetical protein [Myxococcota bacterium]
MGANKMFWPQELLDEWTLEERVTIMGHRLTIASEKRSYSIAQALFFQADVADGTDPHHLVGRVRPLSDIRAMGGEHYMDSVVLGDTAYSVVIGFTGEPENTDSPPSPEENLAALETEAPDTSNDPQSIATAFSAQTGAGEESTDQELLAKFLLENL